MVVAVKKMPEAKGVVGGIEKLKIYMCNTAGMSKIETKMSKSCSSCPYVGQLRRKIQKYM
jgi:hypothetical protein